VEAVSVETILVEIIDGHGRVQAWQRLQLTEISRKLTIGRSVHADVTLDDPFAAGLHAAIEVRPDGRVAVSDLGSVNGVVVAGKRCHGVRDLDLPDNALQVGRTRLRIRTAREALDPERPDQLRPGYLLQQPVWIAGIAATACMLQTIYTTWLGAPGDLVAAAVSALGLTVAVIAVWVSFWGLLSRVMQGEWRWARHAAIFLSVVAAFTALTGVVDLGSFAFALPSWSHRSAWLAAIALGCALFLHLTSASPITRGRAAQIALLIPLLIAAGNQWLDERSRRRNVNNIGEAVRIYPPILRLRGSNTVDDYFRNCAALQQAADGKLASALANEAADDR
jgi:FHA domain